MNATNVVERVRVADGGRQIAAQVGTHLVGGVAELLELPSALSEAMAPTVRRRSKQGPNRTTTAAGGWMTRALPTPGGRLCPALRKLAGRGSIGRRNYPSHRMGEPLRNDYVW